jgi:putative PIN family toxin of toxin-antitoxin system
VPATSLRVVLDTNVLLRGLLNSRSAAGKVLHAVETRRVLLLLSKPVVDEYAAVLTDPEVLERFPALTEKRVKYLLSGCGITPTTVESLRADSNLKEIQGIRNLSNWQSLEVQPT